MTTTATWRLLLALDGPLVNQSEAFRKASQRLDAHNVRTLLTAMARYDITTADDATIEAATVLKALASMYDYAHHGLQRNHDQALAALREAGRLYLGHGQFADLSRLHYLVCALADGAIVADLYRFAAELVEDELEPEHAAEILGRITPVRRKPLNWLLHKLYRATMLQFYIWRYDLGWSRRRPRSPKSTVSA